MTHPALLTRFLGHFDTDSALVLKPSGAITASGHLAATGGAENPIVDIGEGLVEGDVVIDITALLATAGNAIEIFVTGTVSDATFGTDANIEELAELPRIGDVAARLTDANAPDDVISSGQTVERIVLPFRNVRFNRMFRYIRIYTNVVSAGTITYSAWFVPRIGDFGVV